MCTINIKELLENRTYPEAGSVLYDKIVQIIEKDENVILDMSAVDTIPSMFLNMSIGKFIDNYGFDKLKNKVSFEKISKSQAERIKDYILRVTGNK